MQNVLAGRVVQLEAGEQCIVFFRPIRNFDVRREVWLEELCKAGASRRLSFPKWNADELDGDQKSRRAGSSDLGISALTVNIGSFTTWLRWRFIATLQRIYAWMGVNPQRSTSRSIMREVAARAAPAASVSDSTTSHASPPISWPRAAPDSTTGADEPLLLVKPEAERYIGGAFDAVDADLAVALRGMGVARGEQRARVENREIQGGSGGELPHVHIAAEWTGRARAKFAVFGARDAHHSAEWAERHDRWRQRSAHGAFELPVKEEWLAEAVLQEAEAGNHAGPAPAPVRHLEHVNLQDVARLGAVHVDRAGECVDAIAVDLEKFGERHFRIHLRAA